jgi:hypothetical protein
MEKMYGVPKMEGARRVQRESRKDEMGLRPAQAPEWSQQNRDKSAA